MQEMIYTEFFTQGDLVSYVISISIQEGRMTNILEWCKNILLLLILTLKIVF